MDLQALKTELTADSLGLGLAAASDADASDLLNAHTRDAACDIPLGAFQGLLASRGRWSGLKAFIKNARPDGELGDLWDAVDTMMDLIMAGRVTVIAAPDLPQVAGQLDGLTAIGLLTLDDKAALLALGTRKGSRAEELGLGLVTPSDVADARRLAG